MVGHTRRFNPSHQFVHQEILTSWANKASNEISVFNEFYFKDLSNVELKWQLLLDGKVAKEGVISDLDVKPQATKAIKLPLELPDKSSYKVAANKFDFVYIINQSQIKENLRELPKNVYYIGTAEGLSKYNL